MIIVEERQRAEQVAQDHPSFKQATLTLDWEKRCQGHGKRTSDDGVEFAISLPHGTILQEGDALVLDAIETVVCIKEADERVYRINPQSPKECAYYAYQIGNRHQPLMIEDYQLICLQNAATKSILEQLQAPFVAEEHPFNSARVMTGHAH